MGGKWCVHCSLMGSAKLESWNIWHHLHVITTINETQRESFCAQLFLWLQHTKHQHMQHRILWVDKVLLVNGLKVTYTLPNTHTLMTPFACTLTHACMPIHRHVHIPCTLCYLCILNCYCFLVRAILTKTGNLKIFLQTKNWTS